MEFKKERKNEKGAALVMVLMLALLLLIASAGLLLEVSMNTANVTDAIAEQQAYNAAESGIQSSLNVLRGNTVPSVLLDASKPATDPVNRIDFRKAVSLSTSNLSGDSSSDARLSRWMSYNYTPSGASQSDRITLNPNYQPINGYAFSITVADPDNTGEIVSFNTQGRMFDPSDNTWKSTIIIGTAPNLVTLSYAPNTANNLNVSSGVANTNFGTFGIVGTNASISQDIRFQIVINMTAPYTVSKVIRGWIKAGNISATSPARFDFDSPVYQIMGSTITLNSDPLNVSIGINTAINGTMTAAEPYRVVVTSTGYGPRGARKVLEATVQKNFFNGMTAPATLMLVGNSTGSIFEPGSSNVTEYSGDDVVSNVIIPPIGTTNDANLSLVFDKIRREPPHPFNGNVIGTPANVSQEMPFWLESPTNLDSTLQSLKLTAIASGRYFASGTTPSNVGDNATARGITFVDGDFTLNGSGGGILVVTGKLTLHGNFSFNGLIIVTGDNGVDRRGGGNGTIQGNVIVAPYNPSNLSAGFLSPKYDLSGGGDSGVVYNSSSVANGMVAVSNFVLAVAEK
jgi:hypothetical protein